MKAITSKNTEPELLDSEQLISRRTLALRHGVSVETVKRREAAGLLKPLRFNQRLIRYRLSDVIAYEEAAAA